MIIKVYLDIYITVNLIIILVINILTSMILKEKVKKIRLVVSSTIISVIMSMAYVVLNLGKLELILVGIACLILNSYIIYYINKLCKLMCVMMYTLLSTMIVQMSLYTILNFYHKFTLIVLISSFLLTYVILTFIKIRLRKLFKYKYIYKVEIQLMNKTISLNAFIDTGNFSTYRLNGLSYIENSKIRELIDINGIKNIKQTFNSQISTISYNKNVDIIIANYIKILNFEGGEKLIKNPAIGIIDKKLSSTDEFNMILSPKILI